MLTSAAVQSSGVTPSELAAEGGGRGIVLSEIPDVSMGMNIINDVCDDDDDFQRRNWSNDTNITSESFYAQTSDLQQHQQSRGTTYSYVSGGASSSQLGGGGGGGPLLRAVGPFGSGSFVASNYLDRMGTSSTATTTNINNHPNTSSRKMNGFKGHRYTLSNGSIPVSQYRHLPLPQNQSGTDLSQQNFKDIMVRDITVKDKGGTQNRPR